MVKILYTQFESELPENLWKQCLNQLSASFHERIGRFIHWQDRHAHLFGKLLLLKGLQEFVNGPVYLEQLKRNPYGKPYLDSEIDFNLSHSGSLVLCGIARGMKLGIDTEKIRPIQLENYRSVFSEQEWNRIQEAENPLACFFKFWTIKESITKAEGKGLSIPLIEIQIADENCISLGDTTWYLQDLKIDPGYASWMATNVPTQEDIVFQYINFYR